MVERIEEEFLFAGRDVGFAEDYFAEGLPSGEIQCR